MCRQISHVCCHISNIITINIIIIIIIIIIRQMSGAMIRISRSDDPATAADEERQINITGNPDSVALAKSLINMSLDLHKVKLISLR